MVEQFCKSILQIVGRKKRGKNSEITNNEKYNLFSEI